MSKSQVPPPWGLETSQGARCVFSLTERQVSSRNKRERCPPRLQRSSQKSYRRVPRDRDAQLPPGYTPAAMFTVNDLANRFGMHPKSVRERLNALSPLVKPHVTRGRNNAILLNDAALAIFDRLIQLEREGYPTATAVQVIQNDGLNQQQTSGYPNSNGTPPPELIAELRARIDEQARMIAYLQAKLDEALAKLPALPPPNGAKLSRWQALRLALLGR